jgi:hypothetical protein
MRLGTLLDSPFFHSSDPALNRTAFRKKGRENIKMRKRRNTPKYKKRWFGK